MLKMSGGPRKQKESGKDIRDIASEYSISRNCQADEK